MIDTANITASFAGGLDNKSGGGFVKASVAREPDGAGAFTLRLDGGREVSVLVEEGNAKAAMAPGQNVLVNLQEGKILVPGAAQPAQTQEPPIDLPPQPAVPAAGQPAQTPIQPHPGLDADVFIAGEVSKQVRGSAESPFLRSLPAELIEKIARERGGIDADALRALDAALRSRSLPIDTSSPLQLERLEQWLRLALDNPKLAEDLAGRIPLLGAREILEKFLQLQRFGANFLPDNLLRQLSAELFFLGNDTGAGQNAGIDAGSLSDGVLGGASKGELLKELFVKAFSAAPAALLDLVGRIDSSEINADSVKLPPEEARRIVGELVNRLPSQAALKPELVHNMKRLPPRVAEAANAPAREPAASAPPVTPDRKTELPDARITPDRAEPPARNIPQKTELPDARITPDRAEPLARNIPQKTELPNTHITPDRAEPPARNIPQKTELPDARITPDRAEPPARNIPQKTELPDARITPDRAEPHARNMPQKTELPNTHITPDKAEPPGGARYPVPQSVYVRMESAPSFNIPAENKNAVFSQIDAAQETIRQVIAKHAINDNAPALPAARQADISGTPPKAAPDNVIVRQPININGNIAPDSNHTPALPDARQADISGTPPKAAPDSVIVRQPINTNGNITTYNNHTPALHAARQADFSGTPPKTAPDSVIVRQPININGNITPYNNHTPALPAARQADISGTPPKTAPDNVIVRQPININGNITPDNNHTPALPDARQADFSGTPPKTAPDSVTVRQPININGNITTYNNHTPALPDARQADISGTPPKAAPDNVIVRQPVNINGNIAPDSNHTPALHAARQADISGTPPKAAPDSVIVRQPVNINGNIAPDSNHTPALPAPDLLTLAGQRLLAGIDNLRAGFQEAFASLDLQSRVFPSDFSGGAEPEAVRRSLDALRLETLLSASRALQNIFSIVDELRGVIELFSGRQRELTGAEKLLTRAAENLARQARQTGGEITDRLNGMLRELNRMQADGSRDGGALAARQSPAEIMRSAALTAAGGLESLNLLASTARGQQLEQQVVALPVKIGEEWTEVQVKIIKERKGKGKNEKKAGDGSVSVYLNVAPSMLGDVTARLDYRPPASLKLSFQFERPEAAKWFREQAAALRGALSSAGLPGAAMEFHTRRRPARAQNAGAGAAENAGNQAAAGSGKVDFRA